MADDSKRLTIDAIGSYAAVGDSFTEGVGDPGPDGAFVGWADRLAILLSDRHASARAAADPAGAAPDTPDDTGYDDTGYDDFRYANLAVRGRLLDQIVAEQVPRAKELAPDLVSFCAGGNDILRPGSDPDAIAERYEAAVADLVGSVGTVLVCTGFDTRGVPVLRHLRGKIATYTAHVRAIADRHDCPVLDLWSLRSVQDRRAWSDDRLHLSADGHTRVALRAAQVLGLRVPADPDQPWPQEDTRTPAEVRRDNIHWAREHLVPWIGRRLRGESSGDHVSAKRPDLLPFR
ncbi:SGNH/GDSL hydrolase family protein [Streptomyces palmae]|uniref:SGNH/GDSL hydrolase family protein n=1 Tax=Streptomyces palmae TaxID=1701085 RepID=A0A4Z0H7M8_9ACTN|nr:SGNH/GDSL hydrolase family protein [Streptomyces palmae]TGB10331.1 SGNH/GDSL hydrolase family protein [Streptomyces palmae]